MSVRLMAKIWELDGLSPVEKLSLLALADWANDDGLAWPSIQQIATKTGCGKRTVQMAFVKAEKLGILKREQVIGKGCNYTLYPRNTCTPAPHAPAQENAKTPARGAPNTPVNTKKKRDTKVSPKVKTKPKAKPKPKPRPKSVDRPDGVSEPVWNDWVALRKLKKAPVSETALNGIAREAERAGWPLEDALAECVARGWQGFKADWVKENETGNRKTRSGSGDGLFDACARELAETGARRHETGSHPDMGRTPVARTIGQDGSPVVRSGSG